MGAGGRTERRFSFSKTGLLDFFEYLDFGFEKLKPKYLMCELKQWKEYPKITSRILTEEQFKISFWPKPPHLKISKLRPVPQQSRPIIRDFIFKNLSSFFCHLQQQIHSQAAAGEFHKQQQANFEPPACCNTARERRPIYYDQYLNICYDNVGKNHSLTGKVHNSFYVNFRSRPPGHTGGGGGAYGGGGASSDWIRWKKKDVIRNGGSAIACRTRNIVPLSVVCVQFGHPHILQNCGGSAPACGSQI